MEPRWRLLISAFLFFSIFVVPRVRAEPITVVSGGLTVAWDDPSSFLLVGADGLSISSLFVGIASSPQSVCFAGCLPGTAVNLSSVAGGAAGAALGTSMNAAVDGVVLARPGAPETWVTLGGTLRFDAPVVVIPPITEPGSGRISLFAPFVFQGQITGFARGALEGPPLFQRDLEGQGTLRFGLTPHADGTFRFPSVSYSFEAPDPIPEPMTLLLVGAGFGGIALRRRRLRQPPSLREG